MVYFEPHFPSSGRYRRDLEGREGHWLHIDEAVQKSHCSPESGRVVDVEMNPGAIHVSTLFLCFFLDACTWSLHQLSFFRTVISTVVNNHGRRHRPVPSTHASLEPAAEIGPGQVGA